MSATGPGDNYGVVTHTMSIVQGQGNVVPTGMAYNLIVVSNKGGQMYFSLSTGTIPTNGLTATVSMAPMTQSAIVSQLAGL